MESENLRRAISDVRGDLRRSFSALDQLVYLFALTVLIQALHVAEHLAQVIKKIVLNIAPTH